MSHSEQDKINTGLKASIASLQAELNELAEKVNYPRVKLIASDHRQTVGGSTEMVVDIPGVRQKMEGFAVMCKQGVSPVSVVSVSCGHEQVTIKFSADPSNDHYVAYLICHK